MKSLKTITTVALIAASSMLFAGCGDDNEYTVLNGDYGMIEAHGNKRPGKAEGVAACKQMGLKVSDVRVTISAFRSPKYEWQYDYNVICDGKRVDDINREMDAEEGV